MGGRDHSVTCEVCGLQRGGLNDYKCDCDEPSTSQPGADSITDEVLARQGQQLSHLYIETNLPDLDAKRDITQLLVLEHAIIYAYRLGYRAKEKTISDAVQSTVLALYRITSNDLSSKDPAHARIRRVADQLGALLPGPRTQQEGEAP